MAVLSSKGRSFDISIPVVIIGAGACGATAALAAREGGADVLIVEGDVTPRGNTTLSGGQIPAAGSRLQREAGIDDPPEILAEDLIRKARGLCDIEMAHHIAAESAATVDWLVDRWKVPLSVPADLVHPGHSRARMHVTPNRFGAELLTVLLSAAGQSGVDIMTEAPVTDLYCNEEGRVDGIRITRRDGATEDVGCEALILATNGFGGNRSMVRQYIPAIAEAHYHGHGGNRGDAVAWGLELGAELGDMGSFQGFGAVTTPHGLHMGAIAIAEGGILVNSNGKRFCDESSGYSEQGLYVQSQPGSIAWVIFDERCNAAAAKTLTHRECEAAGAIRTAATVAEIATAIGCPVGDLEKTLRDVAASARGERQDDLGRDFSRKAPLVPPYRFAKVMGALFHTQGGLVVDKNARVLRPGGVPLPNLFAGGGAARGLSGPADWGYLPGSGLLTATTLGRLAGSAAARMVRPH